MILKDSTHFEGNIWLNDIFDVFIGGKGRNFVLASNDLSSLDLKMIWRVVLMDDGTILFKI